MPNRAFQKPRGAGPRGRTRPVGTPYRVAAVALLIATALLATACAPDPSKLDVHYGPWEPLHHGSPPTGPNAPVRRIIAQGTGPTVAQGMMIEVRAITTFGDRQPGIAKKDKVRDLGRRWIYVDFDADDLPTRSNETKTSRDAAANLFPAGRSRFAASFLGMPLGQKLTFGPYPDQQENTAIIGGLGVVPFGTVGIYTSFKAMALTSGDVAWVKTAQLDNETTFEIVRLCTGSAAQRSITLHDTTEIAIAQDIGRTHKTSEPRWSYAREARWTGTCSDGRSAHFDFGPVVVSPPVGASTGLGVSVLDGPWYQAAWKKIEIGVQTGK